MSKEFCDLLDSIINEQTFSLELCPRESGATTVSCKSLTTAQLTQLVETVVDNPVTQARFNTTAANVFKDCLKDEVLFSLNVIDRLLFIIETRIQSVAPTTVLRRDDELVEINFNSVQQALRSSLAKNVESILPATLTEGKVSITVGVPLLATELQLNEELYKDINPNLDDEEELREILGSTFVNEIAKTINTVTIGDKVLDLSTLSFKDRLKTVEKLPASLIQKVISYIEKYKDVIDTPLIENQLTTVDGSLFSLR